MCFLLGVRREELHDNHYVHLELEKGRRPRKHPGDPHVSIDLHRRENASVILGVMSHRAQRGAVAQGETGWRRK